MAPQIALERSLAITSRKRPMFQRNFPLNLAVCRRSRLWALSMLPMVWHASVHAQGVATDAQLAPVTVTATRAPLDPNLPSSTASKTAEQLRTQNIFNPEDALNNLPSLTVRKRYFGDRNSLVAGRSYGTLQPGRSLVYLDGYLISNFLGRFDGPRWNMVNTEAIERVDVLYGPFSAIYPGNSMGTTVVVTERKPKGFEGSVNLTFNSQPFEEYGFSDTYNSHQLSARLASRAESGLWWSVGLQRQDSKGHPMGYCNAVTGVSSSCSVASGTAPATAVTGVVNDLDPQSRPRAIFGATTIDHTVQDTVNLRLGYDISATQSIEGRFSWWRNDSTVTSQTSLLNANGQPVWTGRVSSGGRTYNLAENAFPTSQRDEEHRQLGLTWKTKHRQGWNQSVVFTQYKIESDADRNASLNPVLAAQGGPGTVTRRDGTGWNTFELQATYTPQAGDVGNGKHALILGLHRNAYTLRNVVNDASDWRSTETSLNQRYEGETTVTALYAQDAWKFLPDWTLTTGLRYERFKALDGSQFFAGTPPVQANYAQREKSATSPKLSLAWAASDAWRFKASVGRAVRFPNVDELFNGTRTQTSISQSDPNLKPEVSNAAELTAEWDTAWGASQHSLRASLFRDDSHNTIQRQSDNTVTPTVTRISNIDRVLTDGLELVWLGNDVGLRGLDLTASATWADSMVKANARNPATVGKAWQRVPKQRYTVEVSYRPDAAWLFAAAYRWHSSVYNTELNVDNNPNTFGGVSRVRKLDLRAAWRFAKGWEWAFGIDNVGNDSAWQAHTLPQRSYTTSLAYRFQ
jgi:iron complex outermembrane recepter protein